MELDALLLTLPGGFLFTSETVAPLAEDAAYAWIANLTSDKPILVPAQDKAEFLSHLLSASVAPALEHCAIERMTGVHRYTIMRLGVKAGQGCTALIDEKMRKSVLQAP
jgi:hypothetical protein